MRKKQLQHLHVAVCGGHVQRAIHLLILVVEVRVLLQGVLDVLQIAIAARVEQKLLNGGIAVLLFLILIQLWF